MEEFYPQCDDCADEPHIANVKYMYMLCVYVYLCRIHIVQYASLCLLQCVHSSAAVCLHKNVCTQVLIKCGFLYTWLICNNGISACMPVQ